MFNQKSRTNEVPHVLPDSAERWTSVLCDSHTVFAIAGLVTIWSTVTDTFRTLSLDWFTVAFALVPSLCFVHFLVLVLRKASRAQARDSTGQHTDSA
jgi:hypothetical protein